MQESIAKFYKIQTFLDNPVYQPQDNERACRELQIPNPKLPRVKGMRCHLSLKFWQPVAVQAIRDFGASKNVKGCIESDVMRLGKTWVTSRICFRWVYYGDSRDDKKGVLQVKGKLTVDHEIFLLNANAHRNVVVTSYQSLMTRNGPGAIDSRFRSHPSNVTCPLDLRGCFCVAVFDGAHTIRNSAAQISQTCVNLRPDFNILLTATLLLNSFWDFKGLERFIVDPALKDRLRAEGISEDGNPFNLQDGHPAARLRLTSDSINKYIWDPSVNASLAGVRIGKVWQGCMIRRTLMSRLPAEGGPTIGSDIPTAEHRVVICPFGKAQLANYHMITSHLYRGLVMKREGQIIIKMGKYRQLTLFTSWTGFHIVHHTVLARNTPSIINAAAHMKLFPKCLNKIAKTRRITAVGVSTKEAQAVAAAASQQDKTATAARLALDSIPSNSEEYSAALQHTTAHSDSILPFPVDEDVTTAANRGKALTLVMRESPRLRELMKRLSNEVFELKEESIVWTDGPGEQALVAGACHLAGISCVVFHAHLKAAERSKVVEEFNTNPGTPMVFIGAYKVSSSGFNLQFLCRDVHCFNIAQNRALTMQAVGRVLRIGQTKIVKVYEYVVPNSFKVYKLEKSNSKVIPGLMTELNRAIFDVTVGSNSDDERSACVGAIGSELRIQEKSSVSIRVMRCLMELCQ
ncbi:hypothetical protein ACJ73_06325 [Blastomyces percursus]|uniref:Helicase C-terminal domain-containing protein n=1 Tax=Blastomyces percursus TaxID=1658174 RepID=A0A1J9Q1C6_9EURO|nr:hypothetical protein ACJ73_06325 [Blastomyces percursus]